MGIVKAIIDLAAKVIGLFMWWRKKKDNPASQYEQARKDNSRVIEEHDADALNRRLDDDVNRLRNQ